MESISPRQYWPDALTDTPRRRRRAANRRLGHGRGLLPRLLKACGHDLVMLTVPLHHIPGPALYSRQEGDHARRTVAALLPGLPYWCQLERGRRGLLHVHVLTRPPCHALPPGVRMTAVTDPVGLLEYLSKPADGRACRWRDERGCWHTPTADELHAATTDRAAGRQGKRAPWLTWPGNLPRMES